MRGRGAERTSAKEGKDNANGAKIPELHNMGAM